MQASLPLLVVVINSLYRANGFHPIVNKLQKYINTNNTFAQLVNQTFIEGATNKSNPITYDDMYNFFDSYLTLSPNVTSNVSYYDLILKYAWDTPTGNQLCGEQLSQSWFHQYLKQRRKFLDSPNSTYVIPSWETVYNINMSEYIVPTNGSWSSFNQFFTREIKPELRPISEPNNASIIVSPADGYITTYWLNNLTSNISSEYLLNIKGETFNLAQMLNYNQYYIDKFEGGSLFYISQGSEDYHRYHSSVGGYVNEIDQIGGYIYYKPYNMSEDDYFNVCCANFNRRGIVYIDNPDLGIVAHNYVGVADVNSVVIHDISGINIEKGDETGYFAFGGSTLVIIFEKDVIQKFTINVNDPVQTGQTLAIANSKKVKSKREL